MCCTLVAPSDVLFYQCQILELEAPQWTICAGEAGIAGTCLVWRCRVSRVQLVGYISLNKFGVQERCTVDLLPGSGTPSRSDVTSSILDRTKVLCRTPSSLRKRGALRRCLTQGPRPIHRSAGMACSGLWCGQRGVAVVLISQVLPIMIRPMQLNTKVCSHI